MSGSSSDRPDRDEEIAGAVPDAPSVIENDSDDSSLDPEAVIVPGLSRLALLGRRFRRGIALVFLVSILAVVLTTQTGVGQELALSAALGRIRGELAGELTVEGIRSGTLLTGATVTGIRLEAENGRPFMRADSMVIRYSILSPFFGGAPIRSTTFWGLDLEISRYDGDDAINIARILTRSPADPSGGEADEPLGLGRIGIREGRVRILMPAEAGALPPLVVGPDGKTYRELTFDHLDLDLEDAVLIPRSAVSFDARLASFSSEIFIRAEPLVVREAFGSLTFGAQGIRIADAAFKLSGGTLVRGDLVLGPRRPGEAWTLRTELETDGWGDLRDLAWIDPRIPEGQFRGGADIEAADGIIVDFHALEVELEASTVVADGRVRFGDVISMQSLEITASPVTLDRLEPWLGIEFPLEGWLSGRATFSGTLEDLSTSGRVTLVPTGFGGAHTTADFSGGIQRGEISGATEFEARLEPINYTILEAVWPGMPWAGTGSGVVELDGNTDDGLRIVADFTHVSDDAGTSRATLEGFLWRGVEVGEWITELGGEVLPLSVGLFAALAPDLGLQGSVSGPFRIEGPLQDLYVSADLSTDEGTVAIEASLDVQAPGSWYRLNVQADSLSLSALSARLPGPTVWSGRLALEGTGFVLDSIEGTATVSAYDSRVGAVRVDTVAALVRVSGGMLITDSLFANIGGIDLSGRGRLGLAPGRWGSSQIDFTASSLVGLRPLLMGVGDSVLVRDGLAELEREFLRLEGIEPDTLPTEREVRLDGRVAGSASISGGIRDFDLAIVAHVFDATYKQNEVDTLQVGVFATGLPSATGSWQFGATATGIVWGDREFQQGGFEADIVEFAGTGRVELVRRPGESYLALGSFAFDSIGGEVGLEAAEVRIDEQRWSLNRPSRIVWDGSTLTFDSLHISRTDDDPMDLIVDGTLARGGESDFHLFVDGLHVEQVLHVAQLEHLSIGGHVEVDVTVHGPSEAPTIDGTFRVDGARYGAMQLSRVEGAMAYAGQVATFQVDGWDGARQVMSSSGTLPLDLTLAAVEERLLDAPMNVYISADSLDAAIALSMVTPLEEVIGVVSGEVRIQGTPREPEPAGLITLSDAEWSIEAIGLRHTDVNAELRLLPDRTIDVSLSTQGSGRADVTGTVLLEPFRDPVLDLTFTLDHFEAVARADIESIVSGRFSLGGTYRRPLAQGDLTVDQSTIYVDEFQRVADVVDLNDPFIFGGASAVDTTALIAQPLLAGLRNPFFDNLRVDVNLSVPGGTWLRSIETNVEMGGELLVRYDRSAGDFVLIGELEALRGSHLVLGRTFTLDGGTVNFIGRPGLNPDLNIQASIRIRRPNDPPLAVAAVVGGTLVQPVVTLTTDEVGLAQPDLVSYLIFGQRSGDLGRSQAQAFGQLGQNSAVSTLTSGVVTVFGGALANQFWGAVGRGLTLDYLSIQQGAGVQTLRGNPGGYFQDTQVELGRSFGDDLFVVVVWRPFDTGPQQQNDIAGVRLEWALTDDYNFEVFREDRFLRSGSGIAGASGLLDTQRVWGVFFFREWGYSPNRDRGSPNRF